MKRKYIKYLWNHIRFFNFKGQRCEKCGYPMSWGRPYSLDPETGGMVNQIVNFRSDEIIKEIMLSRREKSGKK